MSDGQRRDARAARGGAARAPGDATAAASAAAVASGGAAGAVPHKGVRGVAPPPPPPPSLAPRAEPPEWKLWDPAHVQGQAFRRYVYVTPGVSVAVYYDSELLRWALARAGAALSADPVLDLAETTAVDGFCAVRADAPDAAALRAAGVHARGSGTLVLVSAAGVHSLLARIINSAQCGAPAPTTAPATTPTATAATTTSCNSSNSSGNGSGSSSGTSSKGEAGLLPLAPSPLVDLAAAQEVLAELSALRANDEQRCFLAVSQNGIAAAAAAARTRPPPPQGAWPGYSTEQLNQMATLLKTEVLTLCSRIARLEAQAEVAGGGGGGGGGGAQGADAERTPLHAALLADAADDPMLEGAERQVLTILRFLSPLQTARFTEFLERLLAQYPKA